MENLILGEDLQETMIFIKCFLTSLFCSSSSSSDLWEQSSEDILGTKERPKSFEGGHRERDSTETLGGATKHNMVCIFLMVRSLNVLLVACQTFVKSDPHFEESIIILASIVALVGQAPLSPGVNLGAYTRRKKHCQMHSSCRFSDRLLLLLRQGIQWILHWLVVDLPL